MQRRIALAIGTAVAVLLTMTFQLQADNKAMLIELDQRSGALPLGVSASGANVVGGLADDSGAFYWMPTTDVLLS
jgi:hypothetical protein